MVKRITAQLVDLHLVGQLHLIEALPQQLHPLRRTRQNLQRLIDLPVTFRIMA